MISSLVPDGGPIVLRAIGYDPEKAMKGAVEIAGSKKPESVAYSVGEYDSDWHKFPVQFYKSYMLDDEEVKRISQVGIKGRKK
ncbi:MAG TPA: hypothetical protein HA282_03835 [Nanoarchaeota archaeon]|nr:hypothetical protein [Candidatus Pacearchaeota archaeon]HIH18059.1 hypothetical protein [Nanoarchaeota archaeon]HIH34741.1 hypothetical protein [Nanoarchaeota archaeon]HIH51344.1 hypothetical protein [Nanoarchaeota archaeon]HIH66321.1 hypothetical protein [Nanoarchaeota archaeon]